MDDNLRELMADVPDPYAARFAELAEFTDAFCEPQLNSEYKQLCREMTAGAPGRCDKMLDSLQCVRVPTSEAAAREPPQSLHTEPGVSASQWSGDRSRCFNH